MRLDLQGKKILVTGSSRGIGNAVARELAKAGAMVAVHYHQTEKSALQLKDEFGDQIVLVQGDLGQPDQAGTLFTTANSLMGGLNVLVNNAGIALNSPLDKSNDEWLTDWATTMQINLTSCALLCKAAVKQFADQGGGSIINISSRAAFRGDTSEYWAYAASKGGMLSLTRSIARAFGKQGIVAFNIAPGFVHTDMAEAFLDKYGEQHVSSDIALSRLTTPEDVAPMVAFLATGLADHATGTTIDLNAGSYVH